MGGRWRMYNGNDGGNVGQAMMTTGERTSDGALLARYAAGRDEAAFRELVERHLSWVYGVAKRQTRDAALAEDVAQGVFLALAAKAKSLAGHDAVAGWLFEAARLGWSSALRQRARQKERERMASEERMVAGMSEMERLELAEQLDGAVSKLSRADRLVILAHFYEQAGMEEIARRLGTTEGGARKRLERAVEKLRVRTGVRKPAGTFSAAVAGTAGVVAPPHVGAAVLAGTGTPVAVGISASIQWLIGLGTKLFWIGTAVVCVTAAVGTASVIAMTRGHRAAVAVPVVSPVASAAAPVTADAGYTGDVSGVDGKPLANVEVILPANSGGRTVGVRARTDAEGRFTFPKDANLRDVFAYIPGVGVSKPVAADDLPLHLQMGAAVDAEVTLLAPGGGPAAGVTAQPRLVEFIDNDSPDPSDVLFPDEIAPAFSATTDAAGKCTLRGLPRGTRVWLDTPDLRYAHITYDQEVSLESDAATVTAAPLQLLKAASVSGQLLTPETHMPVKGIEILARATHGMAAGVAVTDAQGNFVIGQMTPGALVVSLLERNNKPNEWVAPAVDVTMKEGGEQTVQFRLSRGGFVKGQVQDAVTGKPIGGVYMGLYEPAKPGHTASGYGRTTDAEGRFEFHVLPGEQFPHVSASAKGYLPITDEEMRHFPLREGETVTANFKLEPHPVPLVEGTVVGPDGQPVAGATVIARSDDLSPLLDESIKTDSQGHFKLRATPGMEFRARYQTLGTLAPTKAEPDLPLELDLAAHSTFSLIVRLLDEEGAPVPKGSVDLITMTGSDWSGGFGGHPRPAGADGEVRYDSLHRDTQYTVSGEAVGYRVAQKDLKRLRLNDRDEMTVTLRLRKRGG